jgi:hypothetical protein
MMLSSFVQMVKFSCREACLSLDGKKKLRKSAFRVKQDSQASQDGMRFLTSLDIQTGQIAPKVLFCGSNRVFRNKPFRLAFIV